MIKTLVCAIATVVTILATIIFMVSQPLIFKPDRIETPSVSSETLEAHVRLLSTVLPKRDGKEYALRSTIEWIEKELAPYGKPYRQSYAHDNQHFHNILIDFGPKPKDSDEVIVIGAHYDTAHGNPGADDNASGVAGLIELARLLSENKPTLKHRVQLAFYTLEEPPYFRTNKMGSFIHAKRLKANKQNVKMMISLDMIGYFTDEENSQNMPFPFMDKIYPTQGNFIGVVADLSNMRAVRKVKSYFKGATDLSIHSFNAPKFVTEIDFSDHLNFWYHGYPAVMVTDTSFNRYKYYHTEEDTPEKLDYQKMAEVVKGVYQTTIRLSSE